MAEGSRTYRLVALGGVVVALVMLYASIFVDLAGIWLGDENYSHGPLLLPVIAYLVWARRARLSAEPLRPSNSGLVIVAASLAVLVVGTAGVEFFLMRASAIGVIAGIVVFLAGWRSLRLVLFPLSLTALIIPPPPVVFYQIAFPLQLLATKFGVMALQLFQIPVLSEGNVITLTYTTLEVTDACSGIRSLISLFALALLYGYFTQSGQISRMVVALSSIPIAILANGLRIAGTGIAAHIVGPSAATGFFHAFSGWVVFVTSFVMLMAVSNVLIRFTRPTVHVQPEPSFS
jgi:exosortase